MYKQQIRVNGTSQIDYVIDQAKLGSITYDLQWVTFQKHQLWKLREFTKIKELD